MKYLASVLSFLMASAVAFAGTIVIYPNSIVTATAPNCLGGTCAGYAVYSRTISQGWGWAPDTNGNTVFAAVYTNNIKVNIQSGGKSGDTICSGTNSLQIANPPFSPKYRFTVYFHTAGDIPTGTNQCGLVLTNFLN